MQQSADIHYVEMANYSDEAYQQYRNQMFNPLIPIDNLPLQINPILNENEQADQLEMRYQFLFKYYVKQIFQILGIALVFGINQFEVFSSVYSSEVEKEFCNSSYSNLIFQEISDYYGSSQESSKWKEQKIRDYEFTWVYYFIVTITAFFILFVAFLRNYRCFAKKQNILLFIQTLLFGTLLGGFAYVSQNNWKYKNKIYFILLTLLSLIIHALFNIVLIKIKKIQFYGKLVKTLIFIFFSLNFLVGFKYYYIPQILPIVEFLVIYFFFYFDCLNISLLVQPQELSQTINIIDIIKKTYYDGNQRGILSNQHYIMINKKLLAIIAIVIGLILFEVFSYFINTVFFIIISIITGSTLFSFIVPTQVAQQNLDLDDVSISVMITYLDFFFPIPNILRRLRK
ncbi:unnamed protein product [Paramecium sonneborni]|uniref:Transmembrane protein n=1 Tax=Paramecium sonneborni TaxID=65129 RepID=A0A8S1RG58_9CILI|nr:unnamed protein product [Paramecium sonneborni]